MTTLTITTKGQITLRKEILQALGVSPGDKVDVQVLPNGQVTLSRSRRSGSIDDFIGVLHDKATRPVSIDEMNEAIAAGWAGEQ